ncbi:macrophage mannose receptor 1-like [Rhinatrema bivittatum]|uniref:macrophage mannose receptor 1-like n=1 Tax=Rhinatrema bivittatum TaxID=194408 RepID=UPI00112D0AB3|nr:macrophage mannose receptor 1-like [Rhinatrema bivittatum]
MDAGWQLLISLCLSLWVCSTGAEPEYNLVKLDRTWPQAQEYCRQHYRDLATVRHAEEEARVAAAAQGCEAWIGYYRRAAGASPAWRWSDGSTASFSAWGNQQPNQPSADWACARLRQGEWYDQACNQPHFFICYLDGVDLQIPSTASPTGVSHAKATGSGSSFPSLETNRTTSHPLGIVNEFSFHPLGNTNGASTAAETAHEVRTSPTIPDGSPSSTLRLITDRKPWFEARSYCRTHHTDLASAPDPGAQQAIAEVLAGAAAAPGTWIGLHWSSVRGFWYWSSKGAFNFSNWGAGKPSNSPFQRCGMVSGDPARNFTWSDECCGTHLPFICLLAP